MRLPDSCYVFRALAGFGFFTTWIVMVMNGSFAELLSTTWKGIFPTGTVVKASWTGIWPVDFVLRIVVVFVGVVNNTADLPDIGPFLMLADLVFVLAVFNMMALTEDRRDRQARPVRYQAYVWQLGWNWAGAALALPIYVHLYLTKRLVKCPPPPNDQAQALPLAAIWSIVMALAPLVPATLGATAFRIQDGVVIWSLVSFTLGLFQDLVSVSFSKTAYRGIKKPVTLAYWIVGLFSAAAHIGVTLWACVSPELSWSRIYWPNHAAVQRGPTFLTEGALLFLQYDYMAFYLCAFALGLYMHQAGTASGAPSWSMVTLTAITATAGPGATMAWLLCNKERELDTAVDKREANHGKLSILWNDSGETVSKEYCRPLRSMRVEGVMNS